MTKRFTEYDDRREWDLTGCALHQISLDYALHLLIHGPIGSVDVKIETSFDLYRGESVLPITIDPELTVTTIPVLPLLHKPVARLIVFQNGALHLRWENGVEIRVPKDEQYESWQTGGTGELETATLHCTPHPGSPW